MTEERLERNKASAQRLTEVILWSAKNKRLWYGICGYDPNGMNESTIRDIIDQCQHDGLMELYYIMLTRIGDIVEIGLDKPDKFLKFLKGSIDKDLVLDMEKIENAFEGLEIEG